MLLSEQVEIQIQVLGEISRIYSLSKLPNVSASAKTFGKEKKKIKKIKEGRPLKFKVEKENKTDNVN